jgi:putative nucleotidyltransferase with HDIG domain
MRKKYSKLFLNSKKENKVGIYQKFKHFMHKNKGFIYRIIIFIALIVFSELVLFRRVTWRIQIRFYIVFFSVWIGIGEFFLGKNKMFKLHPTNFWAAFLTPLIFNIVLNLAVYKYVNMFALTAILSTLIITLLIDYSSGIISALMFALFFGILFGYDLKFTVYLFLPSLIAAFSSRKIKRRVEIILPFIFASISQIIILYATNLSYNAIDYLYIPISNFLGILIMMGVLPFFEYLTRVYSDIGLLELGNLNNPILKELSLKAPGTYYHSMIISNLAESASEVVMGNTTLARVGSYFHDIGKIWRPQFFSENQKSKNPHVDISPKLSSLILNNHVTYGVELARKYRLPILIEDMILQHHGTRVKQFFYDEYYKETGIKDTNMFRYPGPIPQFKEAAILMIADVTEATTRSMQEIEPAELSQKLDELISSLFFEGQFDDCGLTMREIKKIKGKIMRTILEMNHKRISYPKIDVKELKE